MLKIITGKDMEKLTVKFCIIFGILIVTSTFFTNSSYAGKCTVVKLNYKNSIVVGQNFDWPDKYAYLVINPVGVSRRSIDLKNNRKALQWVSKYGSVTIDLAHKNGQVNTTVAATGINQFGLSASVLWLESTQYPLPITKPEIGTTEWVQYFLDNAKTVAEAITLAKSVDIESTIYQGKKSLVHLFVHDSLGESAVMEDIKGKLVIYTGNDLPIPVLTNNRYAHAVQNLRKYKGFGGTLPLPGGFGSLSRFVLAANFLKTLPPLSSLSQTIAQTFNCLGYVIEIPSAAFPTVWSVTFDLSNKVLYYRNIDNAKIRFINLKDFNFTTSERTKILLINNNYSGDVKRYFQVLIPH